MIPIYNQLDVHYTIEQELALAGDIVAQPNTEYTANAGHVLNLPDVLTTELGSVVILIQVTGTSTVEDHTSRRDLYDEDEELDTLEVAAGETVGFFLHYTYGRRQWVQLSPLLFASGGGGGTANPLEVFTVPDIASRDALPIGGNIGQVSEGDVAVVLDSDGQGTKQNYTYFTATGWMISTELTEVYTEQFFAADIAARDALPTGPGVNKVSIGDNVTVADGDGAGTKKIFQWGGDVEEYILIYSEDLANPEETFTVADLAARDALIIGNGDGEVSDGDTVRVDDYDGYGNAAMYTYYTGTGYVLSSTYGHEALLRLGQESKELTGFVDNDNIVSSYNSTTRRVTLTHPSGEIKYIWQNSIRSLTSPWISDPHPDATNNYFLMMQDGGTPIWSIVPWEFYYLPMAFVTYDIVAGVRMGVCEPHGIMPADVHRANHNLIGTWKDKDTGILTPGTYSLNVGDNNAAITPGVNQTLLNDEDVKTTLPPLADGGGYTVHWLTGAGVSNFLYNQAVPFRSSGTFIYGNPSIGGVYSDIALTNSQYVNVFCIMIPAMADADSQKFRYVWQTGQTVHTSLDSARAELPQNLNLGNMTLLSQEFTIGFRMIMQARNANTTTGKVQIAEVTDYIGSRGSLTLAVSSSITAQNIYDIADRTLEQTGFVDNANVGVSYNKTNRTITLTHASGLITYLWRDRIVQLSSPWTSSAHAATPGEYFLKSQDGSTFIWDAVNRHEPYTDVHVAHVVYQLPSVADGGAVREVHGFMPHSVHHELHHLIGTWKEPNTGLLTSATYAVAPVSPTDADNTPGVDLTTLHDEDAPTTLPALTQGSYTVHYLGTSAVSSFVKANALPFRTTGGVIAANIKSGVDYTDVAVPEGKFVNIYLVAMPMASDADSQSYRYIWQTGQTIHDSLELAISESPAGLEYGTISTLATEAYVICRLTMKSHNAYTSTGKCRIESVYYFTGISGSLAFVKSATSIPSHKHKIDDLLGLGVTNTGALTVPHGYAVGIDGSGNYRLYNNNTYTFVGINTNTDAPVNDTMHVVAMDIAEVSVVNSATLPHGSPLRIDVVTGRLTLYEPGTKITPIVARFIKDIDGTLARVSLITPIWPSRYVWQLTSMGVITPGSTNILEDDYEGGKLIFVGSDSYLLRTRAKFKVPSALQADFNTYRNNDAAAIFSDLMTPSASPDTFGNWQDTLTGIVSTSLFVTGDEIKLTDESAGAIDGEDLTIQLEFEERILWNQ